MENQFMMGPLAVSNETQEPVFSSSVNFHQIWTPILAQRNIAFSRGKMLPSHWLHKEDKLQYLQSVNACKVLQIANSIGTLTYRWSMLLRSTSNFQHTQMNLSCGAEDEKRVHVKSHPTWSLKDMSGKTLVSWRYLGNVGQVISLAPSSGLWVFILKKTCSLLRWDVKKELRWVSLAITSLLMFKINPTSKEDTEFV